MEHISTISSFGSLLKTEKPNKELYGEYIKKTSELIGRPYMQVFKMVEAWEPQQVAQLYDESISKWRDRGFKSSSHMWWTERKKITYGRDIYNRRKGEESSCGSTQGQRF